MIKQVIYLLSVTEAEQQSADNLTLLYGHQRSIANALAEEGYTIPKDLEDSLKISKQVLDLKLQADLEKELQILEARRSNLATVQEKRDALDGDIAKLRARLGKAPSTQAAAASGGTATPASTTE